MKYTKETRDEILKALKTDTIKQVAKDFSITEQTLHNWKHKYLKKEKKTLDQLKSQLEKLSNKPTTTTRAKQISALSSAIANLERVQQKEIAQKEKKKQGSKKQDQKRLVIDTKDILLLKEKALQEDYGLLPYQQEFLKDNSRFRIVLKSRQVGFTYVGALEALIGAYGGMEQTVISASEDQALRWYDEICVHAQKLGIVLSGTQNKIIVNSTPINIRPNNFRTVQGFSGDIWFDEFAWYMNPKRLFNLALPTITSKVVDGREAKVTIMSTPFEEESLFYNLYFNETKYYMFSRHKINIYRAIEEGLKVDIKVLRDLMDEDTFAMAYECVFADDDNAFFPVSLIKSCVNYSLSYSIAEQDALLFSGYDVGRVRDLSVLCGVEKKEDHYWLRILDILNKSTFKEQASHILNYMKHYQKSIINIDKTGIGLNLAEDITQAHSDRATGVYFTAVSKEHMVKNLKKLFEDKKISIPNDPALIADIHSIKRKAGAKSFLYDSDRNQYGHADRFWSLALACRDLAVFKEEIERMGSMVI